MPLLGRTTWWVGRLAIAVAVAVVTATSCAAEEIPDSPSTLWREPILPRSILDGARPESRGPAAEGRAARIQLFRMPTAFSPDPFWLDTEPDPETPDEPIADRSRGPERFQVLLGNDNPFFDFRQPGDPGGVGYFRFYSHVLLAEGSNSGFCMGLQAYAPAGLESEGLAEGPTYFKPHFAWSCELGDDGTAVHAFVSKTVRARAGWADSMERGYHYGLAVQSPCPLPEGLPTGRVHVFLEALGRYRYDSVDPTASLPNWDLVPGVHWKLSDSAWVSGGVLLPVGSGKLDREFWQITCSWQF